MLEPYDKSLVNSGRGKRRAWAERVLKQLGLTLGDLGRYDFELHAGAAYVDCSLR